MPTRFHCPTHLPSIFSAFRFLRYIRRVTARCSVSFPRSVVIPGTVFHFPRCPVRFFPGAGCRCGRCPPGYEGDGTRRGCRRTGPSCANQPCYPGVRCQDIPGGFRSVHPSSLQANDTQGPARTHTALGLPGLVDQPYYPGRDRTYQVDSGQHHCTANPQAPPAVPRTCAVVFSIHLADSTAFPSTVCGLPSDASRTKRNTLLTHVPSPCICPFTTQHNIYIPLQCAVFLKHLGDSALQIAMGKKLQGIQSYLHI